MDTLFVSLLKKNFLLTSENNMNEAIILAGGKGTRLKSVLSDIPKCMAPVNEKPFLYFVLKYLQKYNVGKAYISVGYLRDYVINNLNYNFDLQIQFVSELEPLGTGGAIKYALSHTKNDKVFVLNGDTIFNVNLTEMLDVHNTTQADITIATKTVDDISRYGSIDADKIGRIKKFVEKQADCHESGLINGGIYILNRNVLSEMEEKVFSMENDFLKKYTQKYHFQSFKSDGEFLDIGIPSDYAKADDFIRNLNL